MKRRISLSIGVILVVALLAGAAFMAIRLLNAGAPGRGGSILALPSGQKGGKLALSYAVTPPAEVPPGRPDAVGQVTDVKDNHIFIVAQDKSQTAPLPQEVLVVAETRILRDTTGDRQPPPAGVISVQETVAQSSLGQIARSDLLEVWGERRGSRLIASVIVTHGIQALR
jgi:hypothetical protein